MGPGWWGTAGLNLRDGMRSRRALCMKFQSAYVRVRGFVKCCVFVWSFDASVAKEP